MYPPIGFLVVRLPQHCEQLSRNLGRYRGFDRSPWFFADENWDQVLDDAFILDLGLSIVDIGTARVMYEQMSAELALEAEIIAVREPGLRTELHSETIPIRWIGYDILMKGIGLSALTCAFAYSPENRLYEWSRKLNSFQLFDGISQCSEFVHEYVVESKSGRVESCNVEDLQFLEIGVLNLG